jgi:hypothetical protein
MRFSARVSFVILLALGFAERTPPVQADCLGNCVECDTDAFGLPVCQLRGGDGHCYCSLSVVYNYCRPLFRCIANCPPWEPGCVVVRCTQPEVSPWASQLHESGETQGPKPIFQPYFRTTSPQVVTIAEARASFFGE